MTLRRFAAVALTALVFATGCAPYAPLQGEITGGFEPKPAADFTLTDDRGAPYHLAEKRGREVVLFFGYTHCPDVCPTTLANLEHAYAKLPKAKQKKIDIVFVTVDPDRDTLPLLAKYVRLFGTNVIGLRGNDAQLATVEKAWHVWHQKTHVTKSGYTVAHGSAIYFVAPDGDIVTVHDWADSTEVIAADLARYAS